MERRLLSSTVALALVLGTVAASAQTRRQPDQNQNMPQSTPAQPPQGQMRPNPPAGAAQNAPQNAPLPQGQTQPNAPSHNAAPPAPSATTGQAAPQSQQPNAPAANNQMQQPAAGQAQTQPPQGAAQQGQAQPGMAQPGTAAGVGNAAAPNTNANANARTQQNVDANQQGVITLTEQQNTRVATAIRQANVQPLTNVSFSIAVGTAIPADVRLNVLPPELVEIVPQYRDDSFVVVEQEALIVDPNSRTIVAVIPFQAQQTTGASTVPPPAAAPAQAGVPPPREGKKLDLTRDQREIRRRQAERHRKHEKTEKSVTIERRTTTGAGPREPRVGDRVPDSAVIEGRPVEVYRDERPVREERHHPGLSDLPLIGPLFGPRDED